MTDTYTVQRSATIDASPARVYSHMVDFRNWGAWSPWEEMDPDMDRTYSGADSGLGSRYAWSGNRKVGQGSMEMTKADENSGIELAIEFVKPFKSSNTTVFALEPQGDGTTVTWTMTGPQTFMSKVIGIFKSMDSMVGPDFEKGLAKLKAVAEADA